ncbi:MAG: septal ring lytic transglycosylase RlpA family protein [Halioglobus sp.]
MILYNLARTLLAFVAVATAGCSGQLPKESADWIGYTESGQASYYADKHEFKKTASGEIYRHGLNTAAHKKIPFGSRVKVTNTANGKSVVVTINDRGPFVKGRILDLSKMAFDSIADAAAGLISVEIEVVH